jgi:hypothetical protein
VSFLTFEMSDAGQDIIRKQGFYPLTAEDIAQNKNLLEALP